MKRRLIIPVTCLVAFGVGYGVVSVMARVLEPQVQWVVLGSAEATANVFAGLIGTGIKP